MATDMITDTITSTSVPIDDEALFEIVDGERIEMPPMSAYATMLTTRFAVKIETSDAGEHGEAVTEMLFDLGLPSNRNRRPDVAFVKYDRWAKGKVPPLKQNAWNVVPNLTVEVVSPSDFAEDLMEKIGEYFQAGVESVWVVYPRLEIVHRFSSLTEIVAFGYNDTLTDAKTLPGFTLPLDEIFLKEE